MGTEVLEPPVSPVSRIRTQKTNLNLAGVKLGGNLGLDKPGRMLVSRLVYDAIQ